MVLGGSGLHIFSYLGHLGIVESSLPCLMLLLLLLLLLHVLAPRFCVRGRSLPSYGDRLGGSLGDGQQGGVDQFFVFSHSQQKMALSPRARVLMSVSFRGEKRRPFAIFPANATK